MVEVLDLQSIRLALQSARDGESRARAIAQVVSCIDRHDKAKVWSLIAFVIDHHRFYATNAVDIAGLKAAAMSASTLTPKMKKRLQSQTEAQSNDDNEEHLIIGSETYDYEDH